MSKHPHPRSKQSQAGAFHMQGGVVVAGRDPVLALLQTASGTALVPTAQIPDGWWQLHRDGVTRVLTQPTRPRQHKRPVLRRVRTRPAIRARRPRVLTLYGTP
jgi:hypothetical protein